MTPNIYFLTFSPLQARNFAFHTIKKHIKFQPPNFHDLVYFELCCVLTQKNMFWVEFICLLPYHKTLAHVLNRLVARDEKQSRNIMIYSIDRKNNLNEYVLLISTVPELRSRYSKS